ncbi:SpaA isopeptide-forming pilin-related protein [Streptococcus cuniculi]|uniref:LPXTG cell wall anchor domain-containing protein n=1 Tax=Streptococcus cuniculi TaxID=1432788 RepID=A0A4Y9JD73_9STRE|nr:SpaA isopeptide-forming pilin-related protein [Streptococcus cuniculi]MBF0777332.1 LPXTG cell wall anchor domain-containing protein [Streptococcus cuniculi]TFU98933.1 LPXTG cell wall anchor domain-containing protein [Streptococcus cuniculi]
MKKKFLRVFHAFMYVLLITGNILPAATVLAQEGTNNTVTTVTSSEEPVVAPSSDTGETVASSSSSSSVAEEPTPTSSSSSTTEDSASAATSTASSSSSVASRSTAPSAAFRVASDTTLAAEPAVDGTFAAEVRVFTEDTNPDGTEKLEYLTGEGINPYAEFRISGTGVNIKNAKTRITFPKKNIDGIPQFTKAASASSWKITEDADNWYVEYSFDNLTGGQLVAVPMPFRMKQPTTPDGFKVLIKYELFDGEGKLLKEASNTYIGKTNGADSVKIVNASRGYSGVDSSMSGNNKMRVDVNGETVIMSDISVASQEATQQTATGDRAPWVEYLIGVQNGSGSYGKYSPTEVKITEKLPAGAVMFGEPDANGFYNYNSGKWLYDQATHTATYQGPLSEYSQYGNIYQAVPIKLAFPAQSYDMTHVNEAIIIAEPGTDDEVTLASVREKIKFNVKVQEPSGRLDISKGGFAEYPSGGTAFNKKNQNTDVNVRYYLSFYNRTNGVVDDNGQEYTSYVKEVVDYGLDDRLYYNYIKWYDSSSGLIDLVAKVGYKVYGEKADGSRDFLFDGDVSTKQEINDTADQYEKIVVVFNEAIPLSRNNAGIRFELGTIVKEDIWKQWQETGVGRDDVPYGKDQARRLFNSLEVRASSSKDGALSSYFEDGSNFFRDEQLGITSYNGSDYTVPYSDNNVRRLYGSVAIDGKLAPITAQNPEINYVLKNVKHITLLPPGIEFVPGSEQQSDFKNKATVIPNYKNTGKTAVIYGFGDVIRNHSKAVDFDVNTTLYAQTGTNEIEHFVTWDNNDEYKRWYGKGEYKDDLDLDGDGDTDEVFLRATNNINFIPPREVLVKKFVSLDKSNWLLTSPYADLGQDVYYKLSVLNNSLIDLNDVSVLDALPYVGDHKIVPNDAGDYLPRESVFPVQLVESLEAVAENAAVLQKFDVLYSTDAQGPSLASARDANFVPAASIADFTQVKLVKLVLKPGQVLSVKEEAEFILHGTLPYDEKLDNFSAANNSEAVSLNKVDYIEGNQVSSPIIKYEVDGTFFYDANRDGERSDDEALLKGYQVQLMNEDGTEALDQQGQKITAETDENGYYHMNVYKRGNYYVQIVKKHKNEEFTVLYDKTGTRLEKDQLVGNDASQDADNAAIGKTRSLSVNPTNIPDRTADTSKEEFTTLVRETANSLLATRNVGILPKGSIKVVKVDENKQALKDVVFTLKKGDFSVKLTTDDKGEATADGLDFGTYTLIEDKTGDAYVLDTKEKEVTISLEKPEVSVNVVNNFKRSTVVLTKTDVDTSEALAGVTFELRQGDKVIDTQVTDEKGMATFKDVAYGDYQLIETETLAGYVLDADPISVSVTEDKAVVEKTMTNRQKKSSVVLKKVDATSKQVLAGVTFELRQGDKVIDTQVTDEEGMLTFKDVAYGDYTVVETKTLDSYALLDKPLEVSVTEDGATIDLGEVENGFKRSTVVLTKTDLDTGEALAGVTFELRQGDKVIASAKTDEKGVVTFKGVAYGDYQLVETETLAGYVLDATPISVSVTEDKAVIEKTMTNRQKKSSVVLKKVDATSKKALAGVTFELRQGDKVIDTQVTDEEGMLTFKDVAYGDYTVVETKALSGYAVLDKPLEVSVTEDGATINLGQVENHLLPTPPSSSTPKSDANGIRSVIKRILPKTGETVSILSGVGGVLLLGIILALYVSRHKGGKGKRGK